MEPSWTNDFHDDWCCIALGRTKESLLDLPSSRTDDGFHKRDCVVGDGDGGPLDGVHLGGPPPLERVPLRGRLRGAARASQINEIPPIRHTTRLV